ncbi:hypothetical protein Bca52824_033522 [Brassica carinata]|uniref:Uncharacterized protein n=1 Tax=Brassica carinata TaxID=52824 RepID=A0A8X7SED3_BRACI|nr:hypothetical protein Bca52824_033522 [Brassica carinata]
MQAVLVPFSAFVFQDMQQITQGLQDMQPFRQRMPDGSDMDPKPQMNHHVVPVPAEPATGTDPETDMDVDATHSLSPLISQYAAHQYLQKECTTMPYVQGTTVHIEPQHPSPVTATPVHNQSPVQSSPVRDQSPVQSSPVHDSDVDAQKSPAAIASALYDTGAAPPDLHDPSAYTPKSPPSQAPLFSDVDIHLHISADPITPTQPKYDSSAGPASRRACLFPLSPRPGSLESSPTKSQNSIPGFAVHAAGVNAFSATATSHPPVSTTTVHVDEAQPTDNNDVIELSDCDGTPPRRTPTYFPCMEGNYVAKELFKCKDIPAPTLICQLPQIQWDLFYKSISKFGEAFHITPSKLSFSNNFLLQLAVPTQWTKKYALLEDESTTRIIIPLVFTVEQHKSSMSSAESDNAQPFDPRCTAQISSTNISSVCLTLASCSSLMNSGASSRCAKRSKPIQPGEGRQFRFICPNSTRVVGETPARRFDQIVCRPVYHPGGILKNWPALRASRDPWARSAAGSVLNLFHP